MLTRITQLRALSLTPATNFFVAPACSSSLQTELVLMLTRPAEARTILRIGRSWKHHEKQTRRRNGNNRPIITHVTYLLFPHRDNNRKAGPKHLSICLPRFSFWRVGAYQGSAFRSQVRYLSTNYESEADSAAGSFCGGRRNRDRDAKSRSASVSLRMKSQRRFRRDLIIPEADDRRYCELYPTGRACAGAGRQVALAARLPGLNLALTSVHVDYPIKATASARRRRDARRGCTGGRFSFGGSANWTTKPGSGESYPSRRAHCRGQPQ